MTENITITAEQMNDVIATIKSYRKSVERRKNEGDMEMYERYRSEWFGFERALDMLGINYGAAYED